MEISFLDLLFSLFILLVNYISPASGSCDSVVVPSKVSANMDEATFLDNVNTNISEAILNNNKAFCVRSKENFYIQVDFKQIVRVRKIKIQGFILNGKNLVLPGYSLEISYDAIEWFIYNEKQNQHPKFFHHITRDGNLINVNDIDFVGNFVRIKPRWPNGINLSKEFCIRLHLIGCEDFTPPTVHIMESIQSSLFLPIVLNCTALGNMGLQLVWKGFGKTMKKRKTGIYLNGYRLSTDLFLNFKFTDLEELECETFPSHSVCRRIYICKSYYFYEKKIRTQKTTELSIIIKYPEQLKPLRVAKVDQSVKLLWNKPKLNDFLEEMFEYHLTCNLTGKIFRRVLSLNVSSYLFTKLGVYQPCSCSMEFRLKNGSSQKSFNIKQDVVNISFRSLSIRPNVVPKILVEALTPSSMRINFHTKFSIEEQGKLSGHKIEAVMMEYGKRSITHTIFPVSRFVEYVNDSTIDEVELEGLHPWTLYNISVVAFNEDGLLSNMSYKKVELAEGAPAIGPMLRASITNEKSIILEIDKFSFPRQDHNGIIKEVKILMWPGDIEHYFINNGVYEIFDLYPNTEYTFQASAATKFGYGPFGEPLTVSTLEGRPNEPTNLRIELSKNKEEGLLISWARPSRPNGLITRYEIQLISNDGKAKSILKGPNQTENVIIKNGDMSDVSSVIIRAYTKTGYGEWSKQVRVMPTNNKSSNDRENKNNTLVAIVATFVALIVIGGFVLIFYCIRSHNSRFRKEDKHLVIHDPCEKVPLNFMQQSSHGSGSSMPINMDESCSSFEAIKNRKSACMEVDEPTLTDGFHEAIQKEQFLEYYNTMKQNEFDLLVRDFKSKLLNDHRYACHIGEKPENRRKNRYDNVLAYDHSRVILKFDCKRKTSDYINASMLQGYNHLQDNTIRYISTQGPMHNTFNEFWHMIWQERIENIVMVTNLQEQEKIKCDQYWPASGSIRYGGVSVTLDKIDKTADYVIRTFQVEKVSTKEQRTVRHFHFVSWPDHGVPEYPTSLLSLRRRVRHYHDESSPLLVHCSAGIGRSGCFILVDSMLEQIDKENTVDVFNYLHYMRTRRFNMVQNLEQYIFAHNAIMEYILFGNTEIVIGELDRRTRELSRGTGMTEEFSVAYPQDGRNFSFKTYAKLLNRHTDRPMTSNPYKVMLLEGRYVDAYRVDGYKLRNAFVLTKAPSERNTTDFWKMVLEKQCHTIVMLNRTQETSQDYFKYWPDVDAHAIHGDITVLMTSEVAHANIITRKIKVTSNKAKCELHMLQYMDWPEGNVPDRHGYSNICTLMQAVEKSQQTHGNNPIVVHAGNDYGRSGTFIAIYNSTERLKVEQLIDVLQCVRAIRLVQPNAVDNVTQYQFVYNILRTYLEAFENYWNYSDYKVCRSPLNSTSNP